MRKIIAAINMTLDGYCDHTAMIADDEIHEHYNDLMRQVGVMVYGRTTYQLMESYWPTLVKNPSGNQPSDDFAVLMENVPKLLFSRTLKSTTWTNTTLAKGSLKEELLALRQQPGRDIYVGSPSLIAACTELRLADEYQLCVNPVIAGKGLHLFKNISDMAKLTLIKTKTFKAGPIVLYYTAVRK
ncbi:MULTISPECIES: dihydrofolate reductase family protein [unclassified Imperialibacter]|uniref:dihydrofolate reductase family protein n=1 Tax=unclassified Imperialibacter TaxID=2629706 RepID=UPI00125F5100|nr:MULTISPECIES: dihydrofolate reductase family protein [unclassified Imperialibacter]